jgi:polyphenol oxidase
MQRQDMKKTDDKMILRSPLLSRFPWLLHGFSTRLGGVSSLDGHRRSAERGDLNLGQSAGDTARNIAENRRRLLARLEAKGMKLTLQRQIHSDLIRTLNGASSDSRVHTTGRVGRAVPLKDGRVTGASHLPAGDALITSHQGLLLGVLTADCLPILLVDARQRIVAALHCGWRGTARRLAEKAIGRMRMLFGSRPADIRAAIGPGIRPCCYSVGPEVVDEFSSQFTYSGDLFETRSRPLTPIETKHFIMVLPLRSNFGPRSMKEIYLDLALANVRQLQSAGVPQAQIESDAPCTSCHPELFFSHRRDSGHTGRMMGVIGIRKKNA